MQAVSARFLDAVVNGAQMLPQIVAYRAGVKVGPPLLVISGSVTTSSADAGPRRQLSAEVVPADGVSDLWDVLAPTGTELAVAWSTIFIDGSSETVTLGTFDVSEQDMSPGTAGGVSLTAPDRWQRVVDARFEAPRAYPGGAALVAAASLMEEAIGVNVATTLPSTDLSDVIRAGAATWQTDRDGAITDLVVGAGYEAFVDAHGIPTLRPAATLADSPVWTASAGEGGALLTADQKRSRANVYNVIVVSSSSTDGTVPWGPVTVADADPKSPTYASGPFGRRPLFYTSDSITTAAQAQVAGAALLAKTTGFGSTLTLTSAPNAALEPGDTIAVRTLRADGSVGYPQNYLIDTIDYSLDGDNMAQSIALRSTWNVTLPEGTS